MRGAVLCGADGIAELEFFYFHNCIYEGVWKDNRRRRVHKMPTWDVLHRYGGLQGDHRRRRRDEPLRDHHRGGAVEHWNEEPGAVWLSGARSQWPNSIWINPTKRDYWGYTHSIGMIREIFGERMFPLTLAGLEAATRELSRKH